MEKYTKEVFQEAGLEPFGNTYKDLKSNKIIQKQAGDLRLEVAFIKLQEEDNPIYGIFSF